MHDLLQAELAFRESRGHTPTTLDAIKQELALIGYKLDRSCDCRSMARYLVGERAGQSYPCLTTGINEVDTRRSFAHVDARRDENFRKLQEMRFSGEMFAVIGGYILDL